MRAGYTEIAVVLDRSSSMESLTNETIAGFNSFLAEQRKLDTKTNLSLIQFSDYVTYTCLRTPIQNVEPLNRQTYYPSGWTALYDAMGDAIDNMGVYLAALPEHERPSSVVIMTITDGENNKSRRYNREQVAQRVQRQRTIYNWHFQYLGANHDAILTAKSLGIDAEFAADYQPTAGGIHASYNLMSNKLSQVRSCGIMSAYTNDERKSLDG